MRLTERQARVIGKEARKAFGDQARILLFGSRVDDEARGGDIDLYIETTEQNPDRVVQSQIEFLAALKAQLGDQQIDLVVSYPGRQTQPRIIDIARQTGVAL